MLPRISHVECDDARYLLFSTDDLISNHLFRNGSWENHLQIITKVFLENIKSPIVLDIGANIGSYSIPIAKNINSIGGRVVGFEPQRIVYYQLCGNVILNRLDNYIALNKAVGDWDGEIDMPDIDYGNNNNVGAFSLVKEFREYHGIEKSMGFSYSKAPIVKLDSLELDYSPSMIKIDVEGYEINVIKGGVDFLEHHSFPPIIFEAWNFDWFSQQKKDLMNFVEKLGYKINPVSKTEYIAQHPLNAVHVDFIHQDENNVRLVRSS